MSKLVSSTLALETVVGSMAMMRALEAGLFAPMPAVPMARYTRAPISAPCAVCKRPTWLIIDGAPSCSICGRETIRRAVSREAVDAAFAAEGIEPDRTHERP